MKTTLTAAELFPPKCLRPGIWRHYAPAIEDVDLNGEEGVEHVIVTSGAGPSSESSSVGSETTERSVTRPASMASKTPAATAISPLSVDMIGAIARVTNDLRCAWQDIIRQRWYYPFTSRWPNEVYSDA